MSVVFSVASFIYFFCSGMYSLATVINAMKEGDLGEWLIMLIFHWSIALLLFFTGDFIKRVSSADERMQRIIKANEKTKESK